MNIGSGRGLERRRKVDWEDGMRRGTDDWEGRGIE
jgi:hypothetical protein